MIRVYMASDSKHAKRWINFRRLAFPDIVVVSSWIDVLEHGEPKLTLEQIKTSWENNMKDIMICEAMIIYHEPSDRLRGSLFEAGVAYSMGKPVIFVGDPAVLGTLGLLFDLCVSLDHAMQELLGDEHSEQARPGAN